MHVVIVSIFSTAIQWIRNLLWRTPPVDWETVKQSVVQFHNAIKSGQGVVVSPRLVMTAMHGVLEVGIPLEITSTSGTTRIGVVSRVYFEANRMDIALIRLDDGQPPFEHWLGVMTRPPINLEPIVVLSLQEGLAGGLDFASQPSTIFMFDSKTTLCRAQYYAMNGLSGCGIVTGGQPDGSMSVIGVHVAAHDATESPPSITTNGNGEVEARSVSDSNDSLASQLHGHSS